MELGDIRIGEGAGKALVGRLTGCESAEWEGQWGGPPCGDGPVGGGTFSLGWGQDPSWEQAVGGQCLVRGRFKGGSWSGEQKHLQKVGNMREQGTDLREGS